MAAAVAPKSRAARRRRVAPARIVALALGPDDGVLCYGRVVVLRGRAVPWVKALVERWVVRLWPLPYGIVSSAAGAGARVMAACRACLLGQALFLVTPAMHERVAAADACRFFASVLSGEPLKSRALHVELCSVCIARRS